MWFDKLNSLCPTVCVHETKESIPYLQMQRRKVFKNCSLSKAFRTCVMPVLLYGVKTWVVTQDEMRNMKTFHMYTGHPWLHTVYILSTVVVVPSSYSTKMPPALPIVLLQLLLNYSKSHLLQEWQRSLLLLWNWSKPELLAERVR